MFTAADRLRARFAPGDTVRFIYRGREDRGTLIRTNPKRGVVRTEQHEFHIPYERLIPTDVLNEKREQHIESVLHQAEAELINHGLADWHFAFDHSTRRAGCCNYRSKLISISFELARTASDADIRDTILHEIAHALVGKKHNHDTVWKAKAREIGCSGARTHRLELAPPRWKVRCENDCWSHTAQRRNRRLICRTCGGRLVYSAYP